MTEILHILHHAFEDSIKMVPFLFVAYFVIEYIEQYSSEKMQRLMTGFGKFGPFGGAVLGCIPQCGFSAAAANFYSNKVITVGTLVAVFIATSDEAVPLLLSNPEHSGVILKLLGIKIAIAAIVGFVLDFVFKSAPDLSKTQIHAKHADCCHGEKNGGSMIFAAVKHTLGTYIFIFIISVALGAAMEWLGEERFSSIFMANNLFQPFVAALIGFIPNCAASVLLTQLYIEGTLSFGSVVAGLCTGAGVGLAVLFKENRPMKSNFSIMGIIYVVAVIAGLIF
ncbi:MAG: arsenic efflux protein [Clostridia bacterium]|nr:arsenic efflux protein [Clostridia bacterium]